MQPLSVWKTICWSFSGPMCKSIYTPLNQTCYGPPPLLRLMDTGRSFQTQMSWPCFLPLNRWWCAPDLASIKGVTIGRFCLSAQHCWATAIVYEHLRVLGVETFKYSWVAIHMSYSCVYDSRLQIRNLYFSPTLTVWCRCRPVVLYLEAIQR